MTREQAQDDYIAAYLTHRCRNDSGLKINPRHCELRRGHWDCERCPGPILNTYPPLSKKLKRHFCDDCGRTDPALFFGRDKNRCKRCKIRQAKVINTAPVALDCPRCGRIRTVSRKWGSDPKSNFSVCYWCAAKARRGKRETISNE